jgi:hypothetical protein
MDTDRLIVINDDDENKGKDKAKATCSSVDSSSA